jgi:hypothetical protein
VSGAGHGWPQLPQLFGSSSVFVHVLLQSVSENGHAQAPFTHALVGDAQACSQAPQLSGSLSSLTQATPQTLSPEGHWQVPALQEPPVGQAFPQEPQLCTSDWIPMHAPLQKACPAGQASHVVPAQSGVAEGQTVPHAPQFIGSFWVVEQVPLQLIFPSAGHGS